jgi:flagellar protein FliO/FliZ
VDTVFVALRVLVVLGVIVGVLWYVQRRITKGKRGRVRRGNAVTVVGRQGVGAKASVVVVDVDGTRFVLGVTERAVNVLHSGDRPEELDAEVTRLTPVHKTFAKSIERVEEPAMTESSEAGPAAGAVKTGTSDRQDADYLSAHGRASVFDEALKGSILSPSTWRQASSAVRPKR